MLLWYSNANSSLGKLSGAEKDFLLQGKMHYRKNQARTFEIEADKSEHPNLQTPEVEGLWI